MQIAAQIHLYSGALPPPKILREYDQIVPGAAERLLRQAESQTRHRQQLETTVTDETAKRSRYGLVAGVVVVLGLEVVAGLAAVFKQPWLSGFLGVAGPATLAGVFVYGRQEQRTERVEKAKIMTEAIDRTTGTVIDTDEDKNGNGGHEASRS
jgi:uncharacterized membrane protein